MRRRQLGPVAAAAIASIMWTMLTGISAPTRADTDACDPAGSQPCLSCALFCSYVEAVEDARLDVASIGHGIIMHFSADDPDVVLQLQRYAYDRQKLQDGMALDDALAQMCEPCGARRVRLDGAVYETSPSAHGVFTVLTSDDPDVIETLHEVAAEVVLQKDVRGS